MATDRYFRAYETDTRPFLQFSLVANSKEDLTAEQSIDPLVIKEIDLPSTQYGVSHKRILNGALVDRPIAEINEYQAKYEQDKSLIKIEEASMVVASSVFLFEGNKFPMTAAADQLYRAIQSSLENGGNTSFFIPTVNSTYELTDDKIANFIKTYYEAVISTSQIDTETIAIFFKASN